jgi:predicted regulator of Ras-like GTPase activity (Roadblock/LC7/MglB family)
MRFIKFAILFIVVFFLLGCTQVNVYPSENEKIKISSIKDTNNDGVPDEYFYEFLEKNISGVSVKRTISSKKAAAGNNLTVVLTIIVENPGAMTKVNINEKITPAISEDLDKIKFSPSGYKILRGEVPFLISWEFSFSGGERIVKTIEYSTVIFQEPTKGWVEKNIFSPEIRVERAEILIFESLKEKNKQIISFFTSFNFYFGLAIYAGFLFFVFLVFLEIFSLILAFFSSLIKKKKFWDEVYKFVGKGKKENTPWIIGGIIFLIVGSAVIIFSSEVEGSEKLGITKRIGANPILSSGSAIIIFGLVSLIYVLFDIIKGKIYGERYFLSDFDILKEKIKIGLEKIKRLEEKIAECSSAGLDTSTESIIYSIEEKRLKKIYGEIDEENYEIYSPIVIKSISDIDSAIESLTTKLEINKNWKNWSKKIDEILMKKDKVKASELEFIPQEWRKWALAKYHGEHLGEAISLKGDVLSRIKIVSIGKGKIERILSDFMASAKMDGTAVVRKDGLIIASKIKEDIDKNLVSAIAAKMIANAEMVSNELDKGSVSYIVLKTTERDTIIYSGEKIILIALVSPTENTGYVISEAEKVVKKLNEIFG